MPSTYSVSLPMYDFPEIRAETDAWWRGIARHLQREGVDVAALTLAHDQPVRDLWSDEQLLMSQCCGFDVVFGYRDLLSVLVTPVYAVEGFAGGLYRSRVVVHKDSGLQQLSDLRGKVATINGPESHSGMNALFTLLQPLSVDGTFFSQVKVSGAHADSLKLVTQREADVAAIDGLTYALLERYRPAAVADVITIAYTDFAPAPPYVARAELPAEQQQRMRQALLAAFNDPALAEARDSLLITGVVEQPSLSYQSITERFGFDQRLLDVMV